MVDSRIFAKLSVIITPCFKKLVYLPHFWQTHVMRDF